MALSGREILLVLRARDEASRTLRRVSSTMSKMDRDAANASTRAIQAQQQNLQRIARETSNVQHAYSSAAAQARHLYNMETSQTQASMVALRRRVDDVQRSYQNTTLQAQRLRSEGRLEAEQYRKRMLDARKLRTEQLHQLQAERYAIEDASRASHLMYNTRIDDARRVKLATLDQLRTERDAARKSIDFHRDRIHALTEEREIMRARGHDLMNNGIAATTVGASLAYMGVQGIRALGGLIKANMEYTQAASATLTQVDQVGVSLRDIEKAGIDVARTVPVAFDEIQPALYDIFSSIDVGLKGARKLLKQFAKDAVGGQAEMAVATKANLAIMNAYQISVKDAADVSDFMFQLVRKGVGTYKDFATTIGLAIPSAVRLGVSLDELGGSLTFLTRNGLSASRSATSAARAFDALSNPRTADNLKALGVNIRNARGELKPFPEIMDVIAKRMEGMGKFEKSQFLKQAFFGSGGTIQAMRFFNLAFDNMDQFHKRLREMSDATGEANKAFDKMKDTPQAVFQQLSNQARILGRDIAIHLLPIVVTLAKALLSVLRWFDGLPSGVKKAIAIFLGLAAVLTTVVGVIILVVGLFAMLAGAAAVLGIGVGALLGIIAGVAAAFAGLAVVGFLVVKNWDKIKQKLQPFADWLDKVFGPMIRDLWDGLKRGVRNFVDEVSKGWQDFVNGLKSSGLTDSLNDLKKEFDDLEPTFDKVGKWLKKNLPTILAAAGRAVRLFLLIWGSSFGLMIQHLAIWAKAAIDTIEGVIDAARHTSAALNDLAKGDFRAAFYEMGEAAKAGGRAIKAPFDALKKSSRATGTKIIDGLIKGLELMSEPLAGQSRENGARSKAGLVEGMGNWNALAKAAARSAVDGVLSQTDPAHDGAKEVGAAFKGGLLAGMAGLAREAADNAAAAVAAAVKAAKSKKGADSHSPSKKTIKIGQDLMRGLIVGMRSLSPQVDRAAEDMLGRIVGGKKHKKKRKKPWLERLLKDLKDVHIGKGVRSVYREVFDGLIRDMDREMPKMRSVLDVAEDLVQKKMTNIYKHLHGKARTAFSKNRDRRARSLLNQVPEATEKDLKRLQRITKMYRKNLKRLEKAKDVLKERKQERQNMIESVQSDLGSFGGLGGLTKPQDVFGNEEDWTAANITSQLQSKLAAIKKYGKNLNYIRKSYGDLVYRQVLAMGIVDGMAFAEALVQASPEQIHGIRSLVGQIDTESQDIATTAGDSLYNAGIKAAEGLIKGLKDKEDDLKKAAKKLGTIIAREIKKALKIKSPSRVGIDIGANFAGAISSGMISEARTISAAAKQLASAAIPTSSIVDSRPVVGATNMGASDSTRVVHQDVTVYTNEIDPRRHAAELGWELATYGV